MMHSRSNMAAVSYFPSIHDNTEENQTIWAPFDPKPKELNSPTISSTEDSSNKDCKSGAGQYSSTTWQKGVQAALTTSGCLAVPDYRPLEVFSATAEDPGSASWSEVKEMCELSIRMKEIELRSMMGETPGISPNKCRSEIEWYKQTKRKPV